MKKQILFCVVILMAVSTVSSCSSPTDEKVEVPTQAANLVLKSSRMLIFEASLKEWFRTRDETKSGSLTKQSSDEIQIQASALLTEIGISQSVIESKTAENELVMYALEQYSKKLNEMYNQNRK
jgi:transcriptional regulator of met regulon